MRNAIIRITNVQHKDQSDAQAKLQQLKSKVEAGISENKADRFKMEENEKLVEKMSSDMAAVEDELELNIKQIEGKNDQKSLGSNIATIQP